MWVPKSPNRYIWVISQPSSMRNDGSKWLPRSYTPSHTPEPEQKPVCRQFSRCEGCPYPAHGFLCWSSEEDCMRTRMKRLNRKESTNEN